DTRYFDRAEKLALNPLSIAIQDQQCGTKLGTLRCVPEVASQVSLSLAGDLMNATDSHRRVVKKQLSLIVVGKLCEKHANEGRHGLNISIPLDKKHEALHSGTSVRCPGSRAGSTVKSSPG